MVLLPDANGVHTDLTDYEGRACFCQDGIHVHMSTLKGRLHKTRGFKFLADSSDVFSVQRVQFIINQSIIPRSRDGSLLALQIAMLCSANGCEARSICFNELDARANSVPNQNKYNDVIRPAST